MNKKEKTALVPRYRFPTFNEVWESKTFDEMFDFHQTNTFSRIEMNFEQGNVKNIHYGDILIKYGCIISKSSIIPFINNDIDLTKFRQSSYVQSGDIIIADTAEDLTAGKAVEIQNVDCAILSGLHTMLCRPQQTTAPKYFGYFLNSPVYRNSIVPLIAGSKVSSISKFNISKTIIMIPNFPEQQKIADCLSSLDDLITAEDKKLSALKAHKKGLMQKLFPAEGKTVPAWRFPEFRDSGEWEISILGNISEPVVKRAGTKKYTLLSVTTGVGLVSQIDKFGREIAGNAYKNYIVINKGDFAYNKSATKQFPEGYISMLTEYEEGAVPNSIFTCFSIIDNQYCPKIFDHIFQSNFHGIWLRKFISVGARAHGSLSIDDKYLWEMPIVLPLLPEQQKIADCLSSLDDLITAEDKKLSALKAHKKGLMQGLFPSVDEVGA